MPWKEIQPGLFRRPLGENEQFIKLIGDRAHAIGREHWSVTSNATFELSGAHDCDTLTRKCIEAWSSLRFEHPTIATLCDGTDLEYEVPNDEHTLQQWTDETFHVHYPSDETSEESLDDLLAEFRPARYVTAHLLANKNNTNTNTSYIFALHFPHWRTDGYGTLQLINAYFTHLSDAVSGAAIPASERRWGEETCRLLPSVEEALDLPLEATLAVEQSAKKYLATAAFLHNTTGLRYSEGTEDVVLPQGTRRVTSSFSTAMTQSITDACRAKSLTIEAAVQASCGSVTWLEAAAEGREKPYTSTMRFSLRPHVQSRYPSDSYASAICTGGFLVQVPASSSWLDNARHYTELYSTGITTDFLQSRRQYAKECLQALGQVPPPRAPASSEIDISSVGDATELVLPEHNGSRGDSILKILEVGVGVETLTRQVYCFVLIYRDQLQLSLAYNEAYYGRPRIDRIGHSLRQVLAENLGLAL